MSGLNSFSDLQFYWHVPELQPDSWGELCLLGQIFRSKVNLIDSKFIFETIIGNITSLSLIVFLFLLFHYFHFFV